MNDKNLTTALRIVDSQAVQMAPKQHRLRTPDCPPLPRFPIAVKEGWNPEEQDHLAGCAYCQKILKMEQRLGREEPEMGETTSAIPVREPLEVAR